MNIFYKLGLATFVIILSTNSFSQTKTGKYIWFKLYKNTFFELGNTQGTSTIEFLPFSPAISWGEDRFFHEIEINSLDLFSRGGGAGQSYSAGAQYSYNYRFSKSDDYFFQLYIGGGIGGGFSTVFSQQVNNSTSFNTSGNNISTSVFIIPRVTYKLRSNIFLEASVNYSLYSFIHTRLKQDDPSVPVSQRSTTYNTSKFFPRNLTHKIGGIIEF